MHTAVRILLVSVCAGSSIALEPAQPVPLKRLDETAELQIVSGFTFNISPDDQWLVFFKRDDGPERPEVHHLYGLLRVLNLPSGETHAFTLREDQAAMYPMHDVDASWAPDSSMCVLPPPNVDDHRVVITFAKGEKPTLSFPPDPHKPRKQGEPPPAQINVPEQLTCSDCFPHSNDYELFKKYIPASLLIGVPTEDDRSMQCVSPDRMRIYYQNGPQGVEPPEETHTTTLYEIDISTGKQRALITHKGDCPKIEELRPSPDGKKLAYQLQTGCGLLNLPKIYVLDLHTGETQYIAMGSGTMHWTSTSDKLLFYRRWVEGQHGDYLWVADFRNPDAPQTQPQTRP